ncbi:diguanylate cyclase [Arthrobacter sp. AL08]|uniref:sensor domain-containing diguanylate cyclase n=1 Tax=unclassified Arthrobacter TaxID=235627 RepID=UPI00249A1672|nr:MULTISPECIES: diguanylate cyclase [unclassified Arthrobacter]MDI3241104.1 diguanylate cyclase [Arthrobacter sp. AL05]MDI3276920.1 diguanylate cyclase [Arthrobacter sp. AL08]
MTTRSPLNRDAAIPQPLPELPELIQAVLNGIPAMIGYWDKDLRNCLANDAYGEWFKVDPRQMQGIHIRDLLGEKLFAVNRQYIEKVLTGEPQLFDRTLVDAAGATRYAQASYVPDVRDGAVQGFFVLVTDITERVLAERRQQRDMDRYRTLARSIPGVFVLLFDADLRYLVAEGQELEAFGYSPEAMEGRLLHDALSAPLAHELEPRYRAALAGKEVTWKRTIGERHYLLTARPVFSDDDAAGMVVAVDVTARRQQEKTWAALHEIATAVARSEAPAEIAGQVAAIVRTLFDVDSAAVARLTGPTSAEIVSMAPVLPPTLSRTHIFTATDSSATVRVAVTGKPALVTYGPDGGSTSEQMLAGGFRSTAAAPIRVNGSLWGVLALTSKSATALTESVLARLAQFAELVEIAIANAEARASLERQASTDMLSGLPNRRALEETLDREVELAQTSGSALSAVVLDIDLFKRVNDTFGHLTGDTVLSEVAERLRRVARQGETVARFGGEEFVWLLPGRDAAEALEAAERAREAIASQPFDGVGSITISAGVCELQEAGTHSLLSCADRALYAAKHGGRNRCQRYHVPSADDAGMADLEAAAAQDRRSA